MFGVRGSELVGNRTDDFKAWENFQVISRIEKAYKKIPGKIKLRMHLLQIMKKAIGDLKPKRSSASFSLILRPCREK